MEFVYEKKVYDRSQNGEQIGIATRPDTAREAEKSEAISDYFEQLDRILAVMGRAATSKGPRCRVVIRSVRR